MREIKQLIPEDFCLSCHGCCRYAARDTAWTPVFLFDEIVELTEKNIVPSCLFTHPNNHKKRAAGIDLIEEGEGFVCPCLDSSENKCKIYSFRPLDCRLYPFLLARKEDVFYLALDENCPFIQNAENSAMIKQYIQELKTFLTSPEFLKTAKKNPEIFQQYPPEIQFLTPLLGL